MNMITPFCFYCSNLVIFVSPSEVERRAGSFTFFVPTGGGGIKNNDTKPNSNVCICNYL